ncbi:MAG: HAMP domain-containing histidine kinase [Acidimicrobiaceae bacterium]|nr:HAMP domain-containing histidine kinase [Acidimicrobiaceae bacterium]
MNFRSRVILTTAIAAALAVVLAASASFVAARNALLHSADASLQNAAAGVLSGNPALVDGGGTQVSYYIGNGECIQTRCLPANNTIRTIAAAGRGERIQSISVGSITFRELVVGLPTGTTLVEGQGFTFRSPAPLAAVFTENFSGQVAELHKLVGTLIIVAAGAMLIALVLGVTLARNALHPLEEVTDEIEEIATTLDIGRRLDEGGADELGRLRATFNELLDTVEASQSLQRQLVLDASHELRTPLTSLRTNASMLTYLDRMNADDREQIALDMTMQVDELAALIGDLGELARGERSEGPVVELHLDECVEDIVDVARTHARTKNIDIDLTAAPSRIEGRHDRLERAVSNLLTNAVKFTPEGGHVRVETFEGTIVVADSGPGIAEADIPHVFERFWRSASSRGLPGSGLGLSIVDQVVKEFGGTVSVDRDPLLGGARFTMRLPTL